MMLFANGQPVATTAGAMIAPALGEHTDQIWVAALEGG